MTYYFTKNDKTYKSSENCARVFGADIQEEVGGGLAATLIK